MMVIFGVHLQALIDLVLIDYGAVHFLVNLVYMQTQHLVRLVALTVQIILGTY